MSFIIYRNINVNQRQEALEEKGFELSQIIQEEIVRKVYLADILKVMLEIFNYDEDSFYLWAQSIYESETGISSVQLAPDGIVKHIYPLAGNEGAIGHDLLEDVHRDDGALKAIESKELTFIGPVTLIQNGKEAVISRRPVFRNDEFWGFTTVVIHVDDLMSALTLNVEDYDYHLIGENPDVDEAPVIYSTNDDIDSSKYYSINVLGGRWKLFIDLKVNAAYWKVHLILILVALIVATVYSWLHYKNVKQSYAIHELNLQLKELSFKDELTGVFNRRGLYQQLECLIESQEGHFGILVTDINAFKNINDTYGHNIGDLALKHLVDVIQMLTDKKHIIGRIGGDEFLIVFREHTYDEIMSDVERMRTLLKEHPVKWQMSNMTYTVHLSISIGVAMYNSESTLQELVMQADKNMYREKEVHKENQSIIGHR